MADRIGMALRLAKEGRTEGFQYLYEYTVEKQLGKAIALMGILGRHSLYRFCRNTRQVSKHIISTGRHLAWMILSVTMRTCLSHCQM